MKLRSILLLALWAIPAFVRADYKTMDYGPFLNASYLIRTPANNVANRGTAIGFGIPSGKSIGAAGGGYIFDTEMLRPAAWWTGGFLKFDGVVFSGGHGANPGPDPSAAILLATRPIPGWAKDGSFTDPREIPYGPLPRDWARFKGIYRSGDKVVFVYTVGDVIVHELPELEMVDGQKVLSRTLNLTASTKPLTLVVGDVEGKGTAGGADADFVTKDGFLSAHIAGLDGATLAFKDGRLVAELPATQGPAKLKISVWGWTPTPHIAPKVEKLQVLKKEAKEADEHYNERVAKAMVEFEARQLKVKLDDEAFRAKAKADAEAAPNIAKSIAGSLKKLAAPVDLAQYTHGGPAHWTQTLTTKGTLGDAGDPKGKANNQPQQAYVLDSITPPLKNPYDSWLRFGGFDFFKDGRAAVCTWSGDVWIVSGIDDKLENVQWKRYAAGIFQALGLKIVDDVVYVLSRDGITRLHDLNGDGEADFYECFSNDTMVTPAFHEFIFDLHTDPEGNFYFVKGGPVRAGGSGWEKIVPHHGCLFKLSKDGQKLEVVARGFRAPNGMGVGPHGELTVADNEGTWTPTCPINWIKPGGFYGVPEFAGKDPKKSVRDNPLCWLPHNGPDVVDNSNGGQVWITGKNFGPLSGQMLHTSYGTSTLFNVLKEEVDGEMQGGVVRLLRFDSGVNRARFVESQNALFLTGLRGWQTNASQDAGFYRVRYTGKPLNQPIDLKVAPGKITITFSDPLDTATAGKADSYRIDEWNYRWTQNYGSPHVHTGDAKKTGTDEVEVDSVSIANDGKTVTLKLSEVKPVMQMKINMTLKAADGTPIRTAIYNTINNVGNLHGEVHVGEFKVVERKQ
jgi:glucose/arabinose dehydrogenase